MDTLHTLVSLANLKWYKKANFPSKGIIFKSSSTTKTQSKDEVCYCKYRMIEYTAIQQAYPFYSCE